MKKIVNIKNLLLMGICVFIYAMSISCEKNTNFLDKPPGVDVTEDTIFSSQTDVETFVANIYNWGMYTDYANWDTRDGSKSDMYAPFTDEGDFVASWYWSQLWNNGSITPSFNSDGRWPSRWKAIRSINILLARIDGVPNTEPGYIDKVKGQVRFIRALNCFEMFKRYGGIPIVTKRYQPGDYYYVQRSSIKNTVDFIVKEADAAAALLPDAWPSVYRGKATKGAALMLKDRTLLYAASPLFNTDTPYLSLGENDTLICYGNNDVNRWQLAADAAKAVIDWAPSGGISLITDQGVTKNYKYVWEIPDNAESILSVKLSGALARWAESWKCILAPTIYTGQGSINVTFNFVKKYEKLDGTPQTWNPDGGNNLNAMYAQLDPRFAQTVAYNGSYWNSDYPVVQTYQGGANALNCWGGAWLHKGVPEALTNTVNVTPVWNLYRLAEAYLNYAEALNEAQGPVPEAYNAVHIIRSRSGMPDFPAGLTKEQFREKIRNERSIELAYEEHRMWDINRWLIAENEGISNGAMYGIKIYKQAAPSTEFDYVPFVFENRSFFKRMYLHPFLQSEVNKGYLIQNPGY